MHKNIKPSFESKNKIIKSIKHKDYDADKKNQKKWLKKELEEEYARQYIDMQKQIINILKTIAKTKNHYIFSIQIQTICMDGTVSKSTCKWFWG